MWANRSNSLLALSVEVYSLDAAGDLVEADVIKSLETRTIYGFDAMVRNQEILLPAHKEMFLLHPVLGHQLWPRRVFGERLVGRESTPVLPVDLLIRAPFRMLCDECIFAANYFTFKVCRQAGVVFRQA